MAARQFGRIVWGRAVVAVKAFSVGHVLFAYGCFVTQVDGPSMFPTFSGRGEWVLAEALPGLAERVKVGDIIISTRPINPREKIIKRVTALQGEQVKVYRRGDVAPAVLTVPPGHVWVEGDNLIVSRDSREYGPIPLGLVRGRVVLQFLPELRWLGQQKS